MLKKGKVVVGMSGGVDSSVCACLLKEQGYEVIGVTMQIWQDVPVENSCGYDGGCCGESAVNDARRVADKLDIPYYVMNFKEEFDQNVIQYFVQEYLQGRTPNPCNACNRYVKWESLLNRSLAIGADYIATGHYAKITRLPNGRYAIANSVTANKDQTYALYNLTQEQLSKTLMPVGDFTKEEIRKIAKDHGLPVAGKPDSQDICFIPDGDYASFVENYSQKKAVPGNFVDMSGNILGRHKGIIHYTVGQRRGLNLALGYPAFVAALRPESNEVVIGRDEDIYSVVLTANHMNYMGRASFNAGDRMLAKIRYSHKGAWCTITHCDNEQVSCRFDEPVRAITPGQAVVFYEDGYVLGGGTIC